MSTSVVELELGASDVPQNLRELCLRLSDQGGAVILDLSAVSRMDAGAIVAIQEFVRVANDKGVTVELRGVSIHLYKVLKLANLASLATLAADTSPTKVLRGIGEAS